ncbi:MAG: hypothetical protein P9L94_05065 [Candidatus Hinthialibacter antarcticus]|nr:hypothetical protein [Candidatus Hinthialibacter antarcticus]
MKDRRIVDFNENKLNDVSQKRFHRNPSVRVKVDLKDLVKRIPKDFRIGEIDWGGCYGKEEW